MSQSDAKELFKIRGTRHPPPRSAAERVMQRSLKDPRWVCDRVPPYQSQSQNGVVCALIAQPVTYRI